MTRSVLSENRTARVWRLDGAGANTAEFLNIYSEMLGVPVERFWNAPPGDLALDRSVESESRHLARPKADLLLIDLPGIQPGDADAVRTLKEQLAALSAPRVHLVLNAAYESGLLFEQFRAFACFQPEDLSFSHLDEEKSQRKLLDFILGTNCCLRFLSTGQKIPGDLVLAGHSSPASPALAA